MKGKYFKQRKENYKIPRLMPLLLTFWILQGTLINADFDKYSKFSKLESWATKNIEGAV